MSNIKQDYISNIQFHMPDLPSSVEARLLSIGLTPRDAEVLMTIDSGREVGYDGVMGHGAVAYFDAVAKGRDPKVVVNWYSLCCALLLFKLAHDGYRVTHELLGQLSHRQETFTQNPMTAAQMGDLIDLVQSKQITGKDITVAFFTSPDLMLYGRDVRKAYLATHSRASAHNYADKNSARAFTVSH
jgi:aspartyl-tRNA(Asn)/glutamyl-tRNA(Gln) amidotransferase subunit B